jgi:hypothetical protein
MAVSPPHETVSVPGHGRRRKQLLIGAGVVIVVAAAGIGFAFVRRDNGTSTQSAPPVTAGVHRTSYRWTIEHCADIGQRRGATIPSSSRASGRVTFVSGDASAAAPAQTLQVVDQNGAVQEAAEVILATPIRAVGDTVQWSAQFSRPIGAGSKCRFAP